MELQTKKIWKLLSQPISLLRAIQALIYNSVITQVCVHMNMDKYEFMEFSWAEDLIVSSNTHVSA
jgi:hypothetical protein